MIGWRPIASFDDIQRARRALWGSAAVSGAFTQTAWAQETTTQVAAIAAYDADHALSLQGETPQGSSEGAAQEGSSMAKYLSREWVSAGRDQVEGDPVFQEETKGIHASILCVIREQPEHADEVFYIDFRDGRVLDLFTGARTEFDARGVQPTFEVHGDYNTFMQIQEGHLSQTTALMRGRLRLKGSLLKAMRYMRALETVTDILRRVPTEY